MGDGNILKHILDEKGKSVRWLSKNANISCSTLYSIIKRDTMIRYDFALRIANVLNINVVDICSDRNMLEEFWNDEKDITLPMIENKVNDTLSENIFKRYLRQTFYPLMMLFGAGEISKVDKHITNYYQLTDEGRKNVEQFIKYQLSIEKDEERSNSLRDIRNNAREIGD